MLLLERCKLGGKDDSGMRHCKANGLGWEDYFDRVRPYLPGIKTRGGAEEWAGWGKQAVGGLNDHP